MKEYCSISCKRRLDAAHNEKQIIITDNICMDNRFKGRQIKGAGYSTPYYLKGQDMYEKENHNKVHLLSCWTGLHHANGPHGTCRYFAGTADSSLYAILPTTF